MQAQDGSSLGSTGASPTASQATQRTTANPPTSSQMEDAAYSFVARVESKFVNQPEIIKEFKDLTIQLLPESDKTPEIIQRVSHLLRDHPELIADYNVFLHPLYKVEYEEKMQAQDSSSLGSTGASPTASQATQRTTANPPTSSQIEDAAHSYVARVESKFVNQPEVIKEFKDLTKQLVPASEKTPEIIQRVSHLLRDHPELIAGYNVFLYPSYKIEYCEKEQVDNGSSVVESIGTSLTPLRTTQETSAKTANPPTASSTAAAESSPAENLKRPSPFKLTPVKSYKQLRL